MLLEQANRQPSAVRSLSIGLQDAIPKITLIRVLPGYRVPEIQTFFVLEMSDKYALCFNVSVAWDNMIYVNRTEHGTESQ